MRLHHIRKGEQLEDDAFEMLKHERDHLKNAFRGLRSGATIAAMDWAIAEIERLRADRSRLIDELPYADFSASGGFRAAHNQDVKLMRTDFENLKDGDQIVLYPNSFNALHKKPVKAVFSSRYFYCEGTDPADGPDYYLGDVLQYNEGFATENNSLIFDIDSLHGKIEKLQADDGWRTMESAPRGVPHEERGEYRSDDGSLFYFRPTRWRPLPAAPQEREG